nr:hypothetical protein [Tanacetum cinerariifolium]
MQKRYKSQPRRSRTEDTNRPLRRNHKTKKARTNVVMHGPLRKRLYCAKVFKDSVVDNGRKEKGFWVEVMNEEVSKFMQERREKKNKRYKSCGSSSFNTRESGEGSINLNGTVGDEEDEVQEVRSANVFDGESMAKMMANEYVMANDPFLKSQEMTKLLEIKIHELELKAAELEIRRLENCQRDEALYLLNADEELKAILRQRLLC